MPALLSLKQSYLNECRLPLVLQPADNSAAARSKEAILDFIAENRQEFDRLLLEHGGLLLRGFPLATAQDFSELLDVVLQRDGAESDEDAANAKRRGVATDGNKTHVMKKVYTSTEQPPRHLIPQHNEDSFTPNPPRRALFFCETPPAAGGETPIASSGAVHDLLHPEITELFERHDGVKYIRFYFPPSKFIKAKRGNVAFVTWEHVFGTTDRDEVDRLCASHNIETRWNRMGGLQTITHLPAVADHPVTGRKLWFNQAHIYLPTRRMLSLPEYVGYRVLKFLFAPKRFTFACFGDETQIPTKVVHRINEAIDSQTVKFPWRKGDVMILDNFSTSHGRMPFTPPRRILAGLG
jgi:alpha-ketoglutarate-dependent taurine dioxygenase